MKAYKKGKSLFANPRQMNNHFRSTEIFFQSYLMLVSRIHNTGSPRCTPLWYSSFQFNNVTPKLSHKLQYLSLKMSYIEDYMAGIGFFRCTLHFTLDVSYFRYTLSHSNGYCDGYRGLAVHRLGWKTIRHILTFATACATLNDFCNIYFFREKEKNNFHKKLCLPISTLKSNI